jgi:lipopolysaccharide export system protein LptA
MILRYSTHGWILALILLLADGIDVLGQQPIMSKIKNFRVPGYYETGPNETAKLKWVVSGQEAQPLSGGQVQIQGLLLEYFSKTGETNIAIVAADGRFDRATQSATSAGPLKVEIYNGQMILEGTGFFWQQTNSALVISNNVRTTIHDQKEFKQDINLTANEFEYNPNLDRAVYRGQVSVQTTNMSLRCETLLVLIPPTGGQINSLIAETNVIVEGKQDQSRATGMRAQYTRNQNQELIELTGNPAWQFGPRQGSADLLRYDRLSNTILASGHAYIKLPRNDMAQPNSLFSALNPTNKVTGTTNQFIEVYADEFESVTNGAVFRGNVKIDDLSQLDAPAHLRCQQMRLVTDANKKLESAILNGDVLIEQATRARVAAQKAVFNQTNEVAEFTGSPSWLFEGKEGSADRLVFNLKNRSLLADQHARMKLPRDNASQPLWSLQDTNQDKPAANIYLEAQADQYTIDLGLVKFDGHVIVKEWRNNQANSQLACGLLQVMLNRSNQVEGVTAEHNIVFEHSDPPTANKTNASQVLTCKRMKMLVLAGKPGTLTADGGVEFKQADRSVTGTSMTYDPQKDELTWLGTPVRLKATEGSLVSDRIVLDRKTQRRIARGNIEIQINLKQIKMSDNKMLKP